MSDQGFKNWTLDEWGYKFDCSEEIFQNLDPANNWLFFVEIAARIAEYVRDERYNDLITELGKAFRRLCCFVKFYSNSDSKKAIQFENTLSDMFWYKYPGVCYHCTHKFNIKEIEREEFLRCVCLAITKPDKAEQEIRSKHLKTARNRKSGKKPKNVDEWANMIKEIYGPNHQHLSLSSICLHFLEEVGEVSENIRNLKNITLEAERRKEIKKLQKEIADCLSWILGLLNKLDQFLEKSRIYYKNLISRDDQIKNIAEERLKNLIPSEIFHNILEEERGK